MHMQRKHGQRKKIKRTGNCKFSSKFSSRKRGLISLGSDSTDLPQVEDSLDLAQHSSPSCCLPGGFWTAHSPWEGTQAWTEGVWLWLLVPRALSLPCSCGSSWQGAVCGLPRHTWQMEASAPFPGQLFVKTATWVSVLIEVPYTPLSFLWEGPEIHKECALALMALGLNWSLCGCSLPRGSSW